MTTDIAVQIIRDGLIVTLKVSLPMLIISLVVGLIISIFQTITSIQEQTLTFVPKVLAIFLVLALAGSYIFGEVANYTIELFNNFNLYIN